MKAPAVDIAALTDRGKKREINEDAYLIFRSGRFLERVQSNIAEEELGSRYDEAGHLMVVADGMGGAAAGEKASHGALVEALRLILRSPRWLLNLDNSSTRDAEIEAFFDRSKTYFAGMHAALLKKGAEDPSVAGMGTTVTVTYSLGYDLFVVHVGDSRAYLYRGGSLRHITRDHRVAQSLADSGRIGQDEVDSHPRRHILTQVVGGSGGWLRAETHHLRLQSGDALVVCTDGLTGPVRDEEIAQIVGSAASSEAACQSLVSLALDRGAPDNVTVVVARYSDAPTEPS